MPNAFLKGFYEGSMDKILGYSIRLCDIGIGATVVRIGLGFEGDTLL